VAAALNAIEREAKEFAAARQEGRAEQNSTFSEGGINLEVGFT
jgi:hypothetical protein